MDIVLVPWIVFALTTVLALSEVRKLTKSDKNLETLEASYIYFLATFVAVVTLHAALWLTFWNESFLVVMYFGGILVGFVSVVALMVARWRGNRLAYLGLIPALLVLLTSLVSWASLQS